MGTTQVNKPSLWEEMAERNKGCPECSEGFEALAEVAHDFSGELYEPTKEPQQATKYDQGKPRPSLIPLEALNGLSHLYAMGAKKYDARNWEKGMDWSRMMDAHDRHYQAWASGQDYCLEDGQHHLLSAIFYLMGLYTYQARGLGEDDRATGVNLGYPWNEK